MYHQAIRPTEVIYPHPQAPRHFFLFVGSMRWKKKFSEFFLSQKKNFCPAKYFFLELARIKKRVAPARHTPHPATVTIPKALPATHLQTENASPDPAMSLSEEPGPVFPTYPGKPTKTTKKNNKESKKLE